MAEREQIQKKQQPSEKAPQEEQVEPAEQTEARDTLAITDELLDEIDSLLESDAQAFVAAYVQKGGE